MISESERRRLSAVRKANVEQRLAPQAVVAIDMDRVRSDCQRMGIRIPEQRAPHVEAPADQRDVSGCVGENHGIRDPGCWMSSTGETGLGALPRRIPRRVAYDDSAACCDYPPKGAL
jgi:hypothetical protein